MPAEPPTRDDRSDMLADGALGVEDASKFVGLSRAELYVRMGRGELMFVKVGKRRLIPKRALVDLLSKGLIGAAT